MINRSNQNTLRTVLKDIDFQEKWKELLILLKKQTIVLCLTYIDHTERYTHNYSAISRPLGEYELTTSALEDKKFPVLKKCTSKFDCLVFVSFFSSGVN